MPRIQSHILNFDFHPDEAIEVGSLILHSDVLVTLFSTLMIEACICNTPIVNVGYDHILRQKPQSIKYRSIKVDMGQPHNLLVQKSKSTRIAYKPEQLIDYINWYLENPEMESAERRCFVSEICGPFDGQAGYRAGKYLFKMVAKNKS